MVSFCSRSLQYKKLSCLQREGRAQHCVGMALLLFYTTHIITGRLGFRGKKSWTQPWKCTLYPPLQQTGCHDLPCGPILSQGCHPLPIPRHGSMVRWKEALELEAPHGTKGWRWAWAQLSPTWAKRSQPVLKQSQAEWSGAATPMLCGIKSSMHSGGTVRCRQSHFWGFVCHCFPMPQAQGQGGTCRKWPQSCLCPSCHMELSWCHLVWVKHLLFCILLFLILLLLLLGISYSIALGFQKIVISTHILCLCPSLIRSRGKRTGLFEV